MPSSGKVIGVNLLEAVQVLVSQICYGRSTVASKRRGPPLKRCYWTKLNCQLVYGKRYIEEQHRRQRVDDDVRVELDMWRVEEHEHQNGEADNSEYPQPVEQPVLPVERAGKSRPNAHHRHQNGRGYHCVYEPSLPEHHPRRPV